MPINTDFLISCINTLGSAFEQLQQREPADAFYDIFRAASIKEFEIVLEQSSSLLKKRLKPYFASNRQADRLTSKDALGHPPSMTSYRWKPASVGLPTGTTGTTLPTTIGRSSRRRR